MNEPIEHAEESTERVTVGQVLKALGKKGEICSLHGHPAPNRASYSDSFVFELRFERDGAQCLIEMPGYVTNGEAYGAAFKAKEAFWFLRYSNRLADALALLPRGATIAFRIAQDAGSTDKHRAGGLHVDYLYLDVMFDRDRLEGRVKRSILIDTYAGEHCASRPCYPNRL